MVLLLSGESGREKDAICAKGIFFLFFCMEKSPHFEDRHCNLQKANLCDRTADSTEKQVVAFKCCSVATFGLRGSCTGSTVDRVKWEPYMTDIVCRLKFKMEDKIEDVNGMWETALRPWIRDYSDDP